MLAWVLSLIGTSAQPYPTETGVPGQVEVLEIRGELVEVGLPGTDDWIPVSSRLKTLKPGYRLRTGPRSSVLLRTPNLGVVNIPERSVVEIEAPPEDSGSVWFNLKRGFLYLFHRGRPGDVQVNSRAASAAIRGTEFSCQVDAAGELRLTVIDGEVELSNPMGRLLLVSGEQGTATPVTAPAKTPVLNAMRSIQWALHYPGVLDADELDLDSQARDALRESLEAYRAGDLLEALARHPAERRPTSGSEMVYLAALLLAVGQVTESEELLNALPDATDPRRTQDRVQHLAEGVRRLMATVTRSPVDPSAFPATATEWLAESYVRQGRSELERSLDAARRAVELSPGFGFGWVRVAELEFGFGRVQEARAALDQGLARAPRNARGVALRGFLLSAENRIEPALQEFNRAIALDPGLGNGWLGRGLCRIRQRDVRGGLEDLEVAAAVEPQWAVLRSYLGKALAKAGETDQAIAELQLAKEMDPNDPTAWLYSALLHQEINRINEAVRDLEQSKALNQHRSLYRSRFLLDEDRAVRGANLASVYRDAGLQAWSAREAADGVNAAYANYSAHLMLANSYNELRDPNQVDLRYETPWLNEYLLANLLAPVGAGALSQTVSQQEYSRLFETDGFGVVSATEYLSRGAWTQAGAQFGRMGNMAYAVEAHYGTDNGQRANNDFEQRTLSVQLKQQITRNDSVYVQALHYDAKGGDVAQVFDPELDGNTALRFEEAQEPILMAGYHHQWSPEHHTLLFGGWLNDTFRVTDPGQGILELGKNAGGMVAAVLPGMVAEDYESELNFFTSEWQQIWDRHGGALILGARYQGGDIETDSVIANLRAADGTPLPQDLPQPLRQDVTTEFERVSAYLYRQWQVADPLWLVGGLSYDWLEYPLNHRDAPVSDEQEHKDQLSPKAGLVWRPFERAAFRAGYAQSLGGVSFDQSFRLEPSQVAGFNQAWRSLIPESVAGSSSAAEFETYGAEWDVRFPSKTYLILRGEILESDVDRAVGVLIGGTPAVADVTPEHLHYREKALSLTLDQLAGEHWALGSGYRFSRVDYDDDYEQIPGTAFNFFPSAFQPRQHLKADLHQLRLYALFNHPCGFFSRLDSLWTVQHLDADLSGLPDDNFWQLNVSVGYRLPRRGAELQLALLNVTDQDYHLHPLNLTQELPRDRTLAVRFRFRF